MIGCGGIVGLLIGAAGAALWFVNRDVQAAATALAEADRLYLAGQPAAAVAKYKEAYWGAGGRKADLVQRIVDHEAGKADGGAAREWIETGLNDRLTLSFDSREGRALLADAHKAREAKVAEKRAADAEHNRKSAARP